MIAYQNPVWPGYFADPFVLRVGNEYFAYGTGPADETGRPFPVLHSQDLVHWQPRGGALMPLTDPPALAYWAPEVAEKKSLFYLYYSAATGESDETHRLRVAVADHPAGPFLDSGRLLLPHSGFTIDPSPFLDPRDGRRYLFFATDYEADEPHGTGIQFVGLNDDMLSVIGPPRPVVRATAPWQIYQQNRHYKGRLWDKWYCVEGPNLIEHDGAYFCLFSGGQWRAENYGVCAAVADSPAAPWRPDAASQGPTVLRGVPGRVLGPGHNSTVLGPDDKTLFIVYHAWDLALTARRMCIDPILWRDGMPKADGPSFERRFIAGRGEGAAQP